MNTEVQRIADLERQVELLNRFLGFNGFELVEADYQVEAGESLRNERRQLGDNVDKFPDFFGDGADFVSRLSAGRNLFEAQINRSEPIRDVIDGHKRSVCCANATGAQGEWCGRMTPIKCPFALSQDVAS